MKTQILMMICAILNCGTFQTKSVESIEQGKYTWKYNTVGHQLLQIEEKISTLTEEEIRAEFDPKYKLIDNFIDSARQEIAALKLPDTNDPYYAQSILSAIDRSLTKNNFVVCINTYTLGEALTGKEFYTFSCYKYRDSLQHAIYTKNPSTRFYAQDCDLGSILYLSVGEVLDLPVNMVEVPNHNFVRWHFKNAKSYINWDNNAAMIISDDSFRKGLSPTSSSTVSKEQERLEKYLTDMTRDEVIGYYYEIIADNILKEQRRFQLAIEYFNFGITKRPYFSLPMNNLSWMYLTQSELKSVANYKEALRLSIIVDSLTPNSRNFKDTYSCACAANGDFKKAIEIEKLAYNKPDKIKGFKKGKTCLDMGIK